MSIAYTAEKFHQAVDTMIVGDGDVKDRLMFAAFYLVRLVGHTPAFTAGSELQIRFDRMMARITNTPAAGDEGQIDASVHRLDRSELEGVTREILALYVEAEVLLRGRGAGM